MTRILLPLGQSPITAYLHHAYPLSVVSGREEVLPWLYSQYVQLRCFKDVHTHKYRDLFNFYTTSSKMVEIVPHLKVERVNKGFIIKWAKDVVEFLIDALDQGFYCIIYVTHHYRTKLFYFKDVEHISEQMVIGYDREAREFDIYGYNGDDNLTTFRRSFEDLAHAFFSTPVEQGWQEHVNLIRYDPDSSFDFRAENMADVLEDYLTGYDSSLRFLLYKYPVDHESAFGVDVYPIVTSIMDEVERGDIFLDFRIFQIIWEHKRLMTRRLRFLADRQLIDANSQWSERYSEVEKMALAIRLGVLKAIKTNTTNDLSSLKQLLADMVEREVELLTGVVQELRSGIRERSQAGGERAVAGLHT
ncbi:hypothetical protein [Paenibacillus xylaniclasticus]|uniref:hypothetical protein n=1 Tax=Paenibacillus xylaniclasticus TaxID=588083 RepID=UPI000FD78FAF|nr:MULTISPECIES: hypothetical protein [Paenibacillus]GFN29933.1 hypothetical protein PCURB6_01930 [Paenibacillus curdlanolyticus]